jgi:pilus assembly protein CpaC
VRFIPTIIDKDRIRLNVTPSFSTINQDIQVDGIPGLNSRAVSTTVDLREGQWLAIAGLLQDQQSGSKVRVPLIGDIPILDAVFSRKSSKREETELVILVSPELVHPLEAEEVPLILPGMEVTEPDDWGFFLYGYYEGVPSCHHRSTVSPIECRMKKPSDGAVYEAKSCVGYQDSEQYYLYGAHGFSQ